MDIYSENILLWSQKVFPNMIRASALILIGLIASKYSRDALAKIINKSIRPDFYPSEEDRSARVKTLTSMGNALIHLFIWVTIAVILLAMLGINTGPILMSGTVLGLTIGLGSQKIITDMLSGIFIIGENQYRVGDEVKIQNVRGKVQSISIRTTKLKDAKGVVHHVPNGSIVVTTNYTIGNKKEPKNVKT
jgi:moderate conductance mechanosensitive channel